MGAVEVYVVAIIVPMQGAPSYEYSVIVIWLLDEHEYLEYCVPLWPVGEEPDMHICLLGIGQKLTGKFWLTIWLIDPKPIWPNAAIICMPA